MSKPEKRTVARTLYYFFEATKKHKGYFLGGVITTPIVIISRTIIPPLLLAKMIDIVSSPELPENLFQILLPYAIALVCLEIFKNFIAAPLRLWCVWKMEIRAMYDLGNKIFETVSAQSMQFHNNRFSGSLVSQTNKMLGSYERLMDEFFWNIFPVSIDIVTIMIVMIPRAPVFAGVMSLIIVLYLAFSKFWFKKIAPIQERESAASTKQTGQLSDSISNIISVKSYAKEEFEEKRFSKFNRAWYNSALEDLVANTKRNYCFDSLGISIILLIVILLMFGRTVFGFSISTLILIVTYTQNLSGDLWSIHSVFKSFNRIFGDAKEMTEILDMKDDVVDSPDAVPLKISSGEIKFNNISFTHAESKVPLFKNLSLTIKPGEKVGLVGVSGSGKTTLTKLLLRFADVDSGSITIDGFDIKNVTQKSLRENVAYVPQETSLFHRSVADNIAYSKPNATQKEIIRSAKLASADDFIKELPEGYGTLVGERGVKLSGGQRQRIAIARAILKNAPILVLDEATSALDSESESAIQSALNELMKGKTALVVAHRLSTVASLDRIVVFKNGKIIEQGSHEELLNQNGVYKKLWSRQSGAFLRTLC